MTIPGFWPIFPNRPPGFYAGVAFREKFDQASADARADAIRKAEEVLPILIEAAKYIDPKAGLLEGGAMLGCLANFYAEKK